MRKLFLIGAAAAAFWGLLGLACLIPAVVATAAPATTTAVSNYGVLVLEANQFNMDEPKAGLRICKPGEVWSTLSPKQCGHSQGTWTVTFTPDAGTPHGMTVPEYIHEIAGANATVIGLRYAGLSGSNSSHYSLQITYSIGAR